MSSLHYIVRVEEHVNQPLRGRAGDRYESPPHDLSAARALIGMLLDRSASDLAGHGPWQRAIAGGQRIVTLDVADRLFDPDPAD